MIAGQEGGKRKLYLESYGCQMNFSDSEIVASILKDEGFTTTKDFTEADVIFVNTCAIRENAENRVRQIHRGIHKAAHLRGVRQLRTTLPI